MLKPLKSMYLPNLHINSIESCGPVLLQPISPICRMHPEVMQRSAEDLHGFAIQSEVVTVVCLQTLGDASGSEVFVYSLLLAIGQG